MEKTKTAMQERERNFIAVLMAGKAKKNMNSLKNFLLKTSNTLDVAEEKIMMTEMEPGWQGGCQTTETGCGGGGDYQEEELAMEIKKSFCFEV